MFDPQPGFDSRTLGSWEPQFSIYADCSDLRCGHSGKLDRESLIGRYGDGLLIGDLKRMLVGQFGQETRRAMHVFLMSFAYRNGLPRDADLVFDVRFLKNPHYVSTLRAKTGLDAPVGRYIEKDPALATFLDRATAMLKPLLPLYAQEGQSYLTIAVGCTGGQHRSVYVTERLKAWLTGQKVAFDVRHRELPSRAAGRRNG